MSCEILLWWLRKCYHQFVSDLPQFVWSRLQCDSLCRFRFCTTQFGIVEHIQPGLICFTLWGMISENWWVTLSKWHVIWESDTKKVTKRQVLGDNGIPGKPKWPLLYDGCSQCMEEGSAIKRVFSRSNATHKVIWCKSQYSSEISLARPGTWVQRSFVPTNSIMHLDWLLTLWHYGIGLCIWHSSANLKWLLWHCGSELSKI